jgi:outer membrane receptor protein involved in Fe transport
MLHLLLVATAFAEGEAGPAAPSPPPSPADAPAGSDSPDAPPPAADPTPPATTAAEQQGAARLTGTVFDPDGLSIPGASVRVGAVESTSDVEGNFILEVPPGEVEVVVSRDGFATVSNVLTVPPEGATLAVTLTLSKSTGDELTVRAQKAPGGTIELLRERRDAAAVVDVVGTEQMSRAGDTDAAAALKRVNGLTVLGGRFVYVRGLGDRYSQTLLDGASLPSPEPERRVVPLDLFPTSLLESVVVQKTFSPDIPAEMGGGVVSVRTRRIPEKPLFSVMLSGAYAAGTSFRTVNAAPVGPTDFLGFGQGHRALPEEVAAASDAAPLKAGGVFSENGYSAEDLERYGELLPNRWALTTRTALPDLGLNIQAGRSWELGGVTFGALAGLVYSNSWSVDEGFSATYAETSGELELKRRADFVETRNKVRLGGMVSLGLDWQGGGATSTTLLNRNASATAVAYDADDPTGSNDSRSTTLGWEEQQLFFQQLRVEQEIGPVSVAARYAAALASTDEPDRREYTYIATDSGYVLSQRGTWNEISYGALRENLHDAGLSGTLTLPRQAGDVKVSAGGNAVLRTRSSATRRFSYEFIGSEGIDLAAPIDDVLVAENIGAEEAGDPGYVQIEENTTNADDYRATQDLFSGWAALDLPWTTRIRSLLGARVESSTQRVETFELFSTSTTPIVGELSTVDVLPAATLSFGVGPKELPEQMQIRVSYGRTVSRPELRELSEVPYYDYRSGRLFYGNPALRRATIENVDLRWEWYPAAGESVSVAGFFKYFEDPIESIVAVSAVSGSVGTFANANSATNLGAELDVRKRLDFVHRSLYDLYLSGNVSFIRSRVDLEGTGGNQTSTERPLQGQSPWVANVQLSYENPDLRTNIAALYNVFGPRIVQVGTSGIPDTYESPVHRVDLVVTQGFGRGFHVRLKGTNLLDWPVRRMVGSEVGEETREGWTAGLSLGWTPTR